jgi:hypothetical protein
MVGNITAMRALALLGLIVILRWFILVAIVIGFVAFNIWLAKERRLTRDEQRRRAEAALIARADQQQAWRIAGDDGGTYGEYPPAAM